MNDTVYENRGNWIRQEFHLPPSLVEFCDEYFLRVWDGSYVVSQVCEGLLTLGSKIGDESDYIVHWQSTPEICRQAAKVGCSFRRFGDKKYVVIKVWKGEEA